MPSRIFASIRVLLKPYFILFKYYEKRKKKDGEKTFTKAMYDTERFCTDSNYKQINSRYIISLCLLRASFLMNTVIDGVGHKVNVTQQLMRRRQIVCTGLTRFSSASLSLCPFNSSKSD